MMYPDAVNPDLLVKIPLTARTVLDVGCGTAATSLEYRRRNPRARLFGIEMDTDSARVAAQRIDHVAQVDVALNPLPFGDQLFDCIIYGDVLEHLVDPWSVLSQQATRLAPGGVVLICMPNLEHWSFAARLLKGGWSYQPMGLFDHSHLRWFTTDTTKEAIGNAKLFPLDVAARVFDAQACQEFIREMEPGLRAFGVDPADYYRRASPLQHLWRATERPIERINVLSTMLEPIGGVSDVRVSEPMAGLASVPDVMSLVVNSNDVPRLDPLSPKIFIFHRPLLAGEEGLDPVRQLVALGYVVVCEFDDHPDYIPVLQRPDIQNFRAVHAVQTTTLPLAEVLGRENSEIGVFPNAVARIPQARNFTDPDRMTMVFGGINRENEWPELMPVLNAVAEIAGPRLHFEVINDRGFFDALETPHKTFTPLCDYQTYLEILGRSEISFMPLQDTPFNRCKSDLKFLEASSHRVVSLASPLVYNGVIQDGETGVIFNNSSELQRRLLGLLADPARAMAMAEAARSYVAQERMLAYQMAARVEWYRSLWERRAELHAALLERVPELGALPPPAMAEIPADLGVSVVLSPQAAEAVPGE